MTLIARSCQVRKIGDELVAEIKLDVAPPPPERVEEHASELAQRLAPSLFAYRSVSSKRHDPIQGQTMLLRAQLGAAQNNPVPHA